jgi:site-specific recombinase XerD
VKAYRSEERYNANRYMARRWVGRWEALSSSQITHGMVQQFLMERQKISAFAANKDLRHLRAIFNHGKRKGWITQNAIDGIDFFPIAKKVKFVPTPEEIERLISLADQGTQTPIGLALRSGKNLEHFAPASICPFILSE